MEEEEEEELVVGSLVMQQQRSYWEFLSDATKKGECELAVAQCVQRWCWLGEESLRGGRAKPCREGEGGISSKL